MRQLHQHNLILGETARPDLHVLSVLLRYAIDNEGFEEIDWYYNQGGSAMYYSMWSAYLHDPTIPDPNVPLMIWLQGGPGASSQFGAFTELGPIKI